MTREEIAAVLAKLRVNAGGRSTHQKLPNGWEVTFHEQRDDKALPFGLTLRRTDGKRATQGHPWADVYTKGRSMWVRDNVWRLKPETIERVSAQIEALAQKHK